MLVTLGTALLYVSGFAFYRAYYQEFGMRGFEFKHSPQEYILRGASSAAIILVIGALVVMRIRGRRRLWGPYLMMGGFILAVGALVLEVLIAGSMFTLVLDSWMRWVVFAAFMALLLSLIWIAKKIHRHGAKRVPYVEVWLALAASAAVFSTGAGAGATEAAGLLVDPPPPAIFHLSNETGNFTLTGTIVFQDSHFIYLLPIGTSRVVAVPVGQVHLILFP